MASSSQSPPPVKKKTDTPRIILFILLIATAGFGLMYALIYLFPLYKEPVNKVFYTLTIISLGLLIPYWMLKVGMHEAHKINPEEQELHLKDIPKDKQQLGKEQQEEQKNKNQRQIL